MNTLSGIISNIQSHSNMSLVAVRLVDNSILNTIVLETPETLSYLTKANNIKILFKETEVILSKNEIENSSLNNALHGQIKKINRGEVLARVEVELKVGTIYSIITKEAFDRLAIGIGDSIFATINSSEIMLSE